MAEETLTDPEIPARLSAKAQEIFRSVIVPALRQNKNPSPTSPDDFALLARRAEEAFSTRALDIALELGVAVHVESLGDIQCLFVEPPQSGQHLDRVLFYVHGGAFVMHSARSTLPVAARLAIKCNCLVVSVDYALAPTAGWRIIQDQIIQALGNFQTKYPATPKIAAVADSAGAAILLGALMQMSDNCAVLPKAVSLICPVTDLTLSGETIKTNKSLDLLNDPGFLRACFDAYADPIDQKTGFVSPAMGHFHNPFPAIQILAAGHDIFLNDAQLLFERLRASEIECELDIHEKMPHGFHVIYADAPEGAAAYQQISTFQNSRL